MRYAYYISGKASRLQEMIRDGRFFHTPSKLIAVISDNLQDSEEIKELCDKNKVFWSYYDYENIEKEKSRAVRNEMLSNYILNTLIKYRIDYLFVFGHHLLSGELLNVYKNRIIVFHPSLLPHHKGFNGIDQAIDNGDFVIGNSAFIIDEGMDTGKVIMQSVEHRSILGDRDYDAALHPIVDMFFYILKAIEDGRLRVGEEAVIENANYGNVHFFPELD